MNIEAHGTPSSEPSHSGITADAIRHASLEQLEIWYRELSPGPIPRGVFRGEFLRFVQSKGVNKPWVRALDRLAFDVTRFGIDMDVQRWWFLRPGARVGRFSSTVGPSRWRDTRTVRLDYGVSRLPRPVRGALYDELKPISPDLCLGLGGINAERGEGDHFFFLLVR
jgi:hypothetical protein